MAITAKVTEMSRAMQVAEGILKGIVADSVLDEAELKHLEIWLENHRHLSDIVPFSEAYEFINSAFQNADLPQSAIEEFFDFCATFTASNGPIDAFTADMRRLHGLLEGISADNEINKLELEYLRAWVDSHGIDRNRWPIRDLYELINEVLADGKVTKEEQDQVLTFCRDFSYQFTGETFDDETAKPARPYLENDAPVVNTIQNIADNGISISIPGQHFCFTGKMAAGKRKDLETEVESLGGKCLKDVKKGLDYLVIGGLSNPTWTYATYGRKIEKVMSYRDSGATTKIVLEDHFLKSLRP